MTGPASPSDDRELEISLAVDCAVCTKCVADSTLALVVRDNAIAEPCQFCGATDQTCGSFRSVLEAIRARIAEDWSEVSEEFEAHLLGDPEADWEEPGLSLQQVLEYADYRPSNRRFSQAIRDAFGDVELHWRGDDAPTERDRHIAGWDRFTEIVKHERRYTFWSVEPSEHDRDEIFEISAGSMLKEIGQLINQKRLFRLYPKGSEFWRARLHDADVKLRHRTGLFPPSVAKAIRANRMSPSGVVMFYAAEALATALTEMTDPKDVEKRLTYGRFVSLRALVLLDLCDLAALPSYFDMDRVAEWDDVSFLRKFVFEAAKPVHRDDKSHVEYVPTQAFTEFVRFQLKQGQDGRIDGIRYPSSRDGKPCVVLFCTRRQCMLGTEAVYSGDRIWLGLDESSVRSVSVKAALRDSQLPRKIDH